MLFLYLELKEREEFLALYDKYVVNSETGETVAWHPKCYQKVNPITFSQYLKEDVKMQGIIKQFDDIIESFNTQDTHLMKRIAELEVITQIKSLCELVMETLHSVVNNIIIMKVIRGQYQQPKVSYNTPYHVFVIMVINDMLDDFSTEQAVALYFDDINDLTEARDHLIDREDWDEEETKKNITMVDQALVVTTKEMSKNYSP
jgi:hypothetical protein